MGVQYITDIDILNYRNIENARAVFSPGINIIYGDNGQGKTNFLEAVWLLSGGKSFRGSKDRDMIKFGRDSFRIEGTVSRRDIQEKITVACSASNSRFRTRAAKISPGPFVSPSKIAGHFYRVIFSPVHLNIVSGRPSLRRRFADACLCQIYPVFIDNYRKYSHALSQRNAFLKNIRNYDEGRQRAIFDTLDSALSRLGRQIYKMRRQFVDSLSRIASQYYHSISGGREKLDFVYRDSGKSLRRIMQKLAGTRNRDIALGYTGSGVHKEDIDILLDGRPAKEFASQGQQRSAVIAMKLAESDIMARATGTAPAVLLDDVLSELDGERQDYLLNHIAGRQVFITSCHLDRIAASDSKKFYVNRGRVTECI